jgi:CDP-2,3-bis-(O-geranylgeranyl)-sn-glycerol synthase
MLVTVIQALYFFLPAYVANAVPVLLARYKIAEFLKVPVDFNLKIGGKPAVGQNKTLRGLIGGAAGAMLTVYIQSLIHDYWPGREFLYLFPYEMPSVLWLGFLMGLGEGLGDVIKSFFKRRLNIDSGKPFIPFDQMSFLGALFLAFFFYLPPGGHILAIIIISPIIPVIANIVAYNLGWKKVWW